MMHARKRNGCSSCNDAGFTDGGWSHGTILMEPFKFYERGAGKIHVVGSKYDGHPPPLLNATVNTRMMQCELAMPSERNTASDR